MRKSTLLLASAVCVVNLGFATSLKVIEVSPIDKSKSIELSAQKPMPSFDFVKASDKLMKAPAAMAAPVATEATDVNEAQFTANWNAVDGANGYYVQVGRTFTTTTDSATIYHLYEDFALTHEGTSATDQQGVLLFNEGQTFRDWTLYNGQTKTEALGLNAGGILYSPVLDLSNPAIDPSTTIACGFNGLEADTLWIGFFYIENNEQKFDLVYPAKLDASQQWAYQLRFTTNPVYEQCGFFFLAPEGNKGEISIWMVQSTQDLLPGQKWDMMYGGAETTATSQHFYTYEYDMDTPGVTETFYYAVLAYQQNALGSILDQSEFSNIVVVGEGTGVEDILVSNEKVFVHDKLHVVLNAPQQVSIYNAAGALVGSYQGVEGENEFELPASGIYVVKAGNTIVKVAK